VSLVVSGELRYKIGTDAQLYNSRAVEGKFLNRNIRDGRRSTDNPFIRSQYFRFPADITTASDTTGIFEDLLKDINYVLSGTNMWLHAIQFKRERDAINTKYGFLGISNGCRIFRLSGISHDGYSFQMLLYADVETKLIRKMELRTLSAPEERFEMERAYSAENVDIIIECEGIKGNLATPATTFIYSIKAKLERFEGDNRFSEIELNNMIISSR